MAGGEQMAYSQVYTQVQTVTVLQGDQVRIVHCTTLHSLTHCRAAAAAAAVVPATRVLLFCAAVLGYCCARPGVRGRPQGTI